MIEMVESERETQFFVMTKQEGRSNDWTNDPVQNAIACSVDALRAR